MKEFKVLKVLKTDWSWQPKPDHCINSSAGSYETLYKGDYVSDEYLFHNSNALFERFEEELNKYVSEGWVPYDKLQFKECEFVIQLLSREISEF